LVGSGLITLDQMCFTFGAVPIRSASELRQMPSGSRKNGSRCKSSLH